MLTLIDGSGFIFRAFHALPPMTRTDGTPVNAVYGFCNMVHKLLSESTTTHIAVIFDAGRTTFRQSIYPEYKAHRPPPPPELVPQFALIREATLAFGLPSIEMEGYEADDLIASYAHAAIATGEEVRIVSSDKDLMQLMRTGITLYDPMKGITLSNDDVIKKFGVPPEKVINVQSLMGDSTDNIPGVPGIGVKTAAELITAFGDLDTLLARAHEIKQPKRRDLLLQYADLARMSRHLVTLMADIPLPQPIDTLKRQDGHEEGLISFLERQGFRSLIARLKGPQGGSTVPTTGTTSSISTPHAPPVPSAPHTQPSLAKHYACVQTLDQLKEWVTAAQTAGVVAVDTETTSLTACTARLVGVSLATAAGKACYIPVGHTDPSDTPNDGGFSFSSNPPPPQIPLRDVLATLSPLLRDPNILKIGHNLKYDMQVFAQHGLSLTPYDDTMLMSYCLAAGMHGHGLDELALLHCSHKMISFDEVTGTGKNRITFDRVPLDKATTYAAEDADFTLRLWHILKPQLAQQHVTRVYERIERPIVPVVAAMETAGITIDTNVLHHQSVGITTRLRKLETEIHHLAGHSFNVASPKQLGEVLFDEMGIAGGVKGKAGAYSTSSDVLEPLAENGNDIAARVLDWRGLAKLKSTYTDALPEQVQPKTGRVHTSFSLVGAATGRLSSTDPNLQNIPIRTEDGRAIRRAFVAAPHHVLLSVDYSQIELRLAAHAADITALIQAFHEGMDIHALTASQVFNIPLADLPPEKRRAAKAINFGIIYGISGFGLAKQLGISNSEASEFIRNYLDRFHELRDWMEQTKEFARAHGYVETLFGRRIHVPSIRDKNPTRRNGAERAAINAPLQGTAADIMKRAMIRMPKALKDAGLSAQLLLQVHDELVFEVKESEVDATTALVKEVMQNAPAPAVTLKTPLIAEAGFATNWAEAH